MGGESLVQLDHVEIGLRQPQAVQQFLAGGRRPDPHDARRNPRRRPAQHPRDGGQAMTLCALFRGKDQCRRAIVHARRIASGDGDVREQRFQLCQRLNRRGAGVFVLGHHQRIALFLRNGDGGDLLRQPPIRLRGGGFGLG